MPQKPLPMSPKMSTDENIDVRKANNRQMCSTIKRPLARGQERHLVFQKTDLIFHFSPPIHIFPIAHSTHMDFPLHSYISHCSIYSHGFVHFSTQSDYYNHRRDLIWSWSMIMYLLICFPAKDCECCQKQTANKLTAAALRGISPFLPNKRKLRLAISFPRDHKGFSKSRRN